MPGRPTLFDPDLLIERPKQFEIERPKQFELDLQLLIYGALLYELGAVGTFHVASNVRRAFEMVTGTAKLALRDLPPTAKSAVCQIVAERKGRLFQLYSGLYVEGMYLTLPRMECSVCGGKVMLELKTNDLVPWQQELAQTR